MKLSTKGTYGMKAILDLALHSDGNPVAIKSIAERQNISENYLEQLFAILRKSGLLQSIRGAQGGYILAKNPGKITAGLILRILEGSLAPVHCVEENKPEACNRSENCITKYVWAEIRDKIYDVVDSITLADLVEEYNKQESDKDFMYHI